MYQSRKSNQEKQEKNMRFSSINSVKKKIATKKPINQPQEKITKKYIHYLHTHNQNPHKSHAR